MKKIDSQLCRAKSAMVSLATMPVSKVNRVLRATASAITRQQKEILSANKKDLRSINPADPRYDRALLTPARIRGIARQLRDVAELPSPLNQVLEQRTLDNGLRLSKVSVPLGAVGVIYESRPNVTVEVFSLLFKSGNTCVLKGGKEVHRTNTALVKIIRKVLVKSKTNPDCIILLPSNHIVVDQLLRANKYVDVLIPRGGAGLIKYVRANSSIPVIETGVGVVHTYFDKSGDAKIGARIIANAKTRRPSVCNALDTLIIHQARLKDLSVLMAPLAKSKVKVCADRAACYALKGNYPAGLLLKAGHKDFGREFLSLQMSIKTVASAKEAIQFINQRGSKHSEAIIANNKKIIEQFFAQVDAAALYSNTSTAFTDGGQFGLGAEIGISTQKLHARGPLGLKELMSYKWIVRGNGQIRPV
ncbi:MAG: glutamate-5-semialdehyde dehydrogenase [Candidatus Magasanikbacteria bacterium]|nr:glutamate-5-semialdehyde dehydrogenase [Candidatus Magasanikbacteria bacterium]